ncbi:MAG TPA: hypothetical protein VKR06_35455 [Ktedonosporobacter sp.]|nr:hypothetical protein [Ktedonosporobacter sp.]
MTTTGELYAIIEELELVDIGDAASYLGEEGEDLEEEALCEAPMEFANDSHHLLSSERSVCQIC